MVAFVSPIWIGKEIKVHFHISMQVQIRKH